jgi:hypothetical protein
VLSRRRPGSLRSMSEPDLVIVYGPQEVARPRLQSLWRNAFDCRCSARTSSRNRSGMLHRRDRRGISSIAGGARHASCGRQRNGRAAFDSNGRPCRGRSCKAWAARRLKCRRHPRKQQSPAVRNRPCRLFGSKIGRPRGVASAEAGDVVPTTVVSDYVLDFVVPVEAWGALPVLPVLPVGP